MVPFSLSMNKKDHSHAFAGILSKGIIFGLKWKCDTIGQDHVKTVFLSSKKVDNGRTML